MSNDNPLCDICKQPLSGRGISKEGWQDFDDNGDDLGYDAHTDCLKEKGIIS